MKKRIIFVIVTMAFALTLFSTTVFAAPIGILKKGSIGEDVKTLQTYLVANGYSLTVDGKFGSMTQSAVNNYQATFGLTPDGIVGSITWKRLSSAALAGSAKTLKKGSRGADVKELQVLLKVNGFFVMPDGVFGTGTERALKQYQVACGLKADGVAGSRTLGRLRAVEKFIDIAKSKLGCEYVPGGRGPNTFDCTGFAHWCLTQAGVKNAVSGSTSTWAATKKYVKITNLNDLIRGDIIVRKGHVSIYLGNDQDISALGRAWGVCYRYNIKKIFVKDFVCGLRIF